VPETGTTYNKERARAPVDSIGSPSEILLSIDRVLTTQNLSTEQAAAAETLRRHIRSFLDKLGALHIASNGIDDAICAQCLAIAPIDALLNHLDDLRLRHVTAPRTLGWFVAVFAKQFMGVSPDEVKSRRTALRVVRKPVNRATNSSEWSCPDTNGVVSSVRGNG